jgi:hypothetical protein
MDNYLNDLHNILLGPSWNVNSINTLIADMIDKLKELTYGGHDGKFMSARASIEDLIKRIEDRFQTSNFTHHRFNELKGLIEEFYRTQQFSKF